MEFNNHDVPKVVSESIDDPATRKDIYFIGHELRRLINIMKKLQEEVKILRAQSSDQVSEGLSEIVSGQSGNDIKERKLSNNVKVKSEQGSLANKDRTTEKK